MTDTENARFWFAQESDLAFASATSSRKVITMMQEDSNNPFLDNAAPNSVIAGVLTHLCE